jgi:hypothetical protein
MACAEEAGLPKEAIEFQTLRGMAEELKEAVAGRGWRMREYVPVGEMIPGMAYLVRRLLENTSNQGWVRAEVAGEEDMLIQYMVIQVFLLWVVWEAMHVLQVSRVHLMEAVVVLAILLLVREPVEEEVAVMEPVVAERVKRC